MTDHDDHGDNRWGGVVGLMIALVLLFVGLTIWLVPKVFRKAKQGFRVLRDRLRGIKPDQPAPGGTPQLS